MDMGLRVCRLTDERHNWYGSATRFLYRPFCKVVLFDMNTMLSTHTKGCYSGDVDELVARGPYIYTTRSRLLVWYQVARHILDSLMAEHSGLPGQARCELLAASFRSQVKAQGGTIVDPLGISEPGEAECARDQVHIVAAFSKLQIPARFLLPIHAK